MKYILSTEVFCVVLTFQEIKQTSTSSKLITPLYPTGWSLGSIFVTRNLSLKLDPGYNWSVWRSVLKELDGRNAKPHIWEILCKLLWIKNGLVRAIVGCTNSLMKLKNFVLFVLCWIVPKPVWYSVIVKTFNTIQ